MTNTAQQYDDQQAFSIIAKIMNMPQIKEMDKDIQALILKKLYEFVYEMETENLSSTQFNLKVVEFLKKLQIIPSNA